MSKRARPIGIDLFAGAGGMSLGFEQAGFDIAAAVEIDPVHCAVHEFNFPRCKTICRSVTDLSGIELRRLSGIANKDVDVLFGGAPCQGFSMIGKRALDDPRNQLVKHFVRLVSEIRPKYFVLENVKGLTIGAPRKVLDEVVEEAARIGYSVLLPYKVLDASSFGVPQHRERLFLIGARKGIELPHYPLPTTKPAGTGNGAGLLKSGPSVWQAIGDLPDADAFATLLRSDAVKCKFGRSSSYAKLLRDGENDDDFSHRRIFDRTLLTSSMRTHHTEESRRRFAATPCGETEPVSRFFKLNPTGICNTLRAGTGTDKGAFTSPRPIHPEKPRCITVREAARLHSYPDWFRFHVTKWHGARQVGNSVPPLLAKAVASSLLEGLNCRPSVPNGLVKLGDEQLLRFTPAQAAAYFGTRSDIMGRRLRVSTTTSRDSRAAARIGQADVVLVGGPAAILRRSESRQAVRPKTGRERWRMKGHASLCVFCEMPLSKRHEHDHFPVPKRNGGRDTFCVCINCHDLKDRTPLASMPELRLALEDVWKNGSAKHRIVLAKLYCMFSDADDAYSAAYGAEVAS